MTPQEVMVDLAQEYADNRVMAATIDTLGAMAGAGPDDRVAELDAEAVIILEKIRAKVWSLMNMRNGRCVWCGYRRDDGHRMYCRNYIGPVEHWWTHQRVAAYQEGIEYSCACGKRLVVDYETARLGQIPPCPATEETWRGPKKGGANDQD